MDRSTSPRSSAGWPSNRPVPATYHRTRCRSQTAESHLDAPAQPHRTPAGLGRPSMNALLVARGSVVDQATAEDSGDPYADLDVLRAHWRNPR